MNTILLYLNGAMSITLVQYWFWGFIIFLVISSFFSGWGQSKPSNADLWASIIWPLSLINIIGLIANGLWGED